MSQQRTLEHATEAIEAAVSLEGLASLLPQICSDYGIANVAYHLISTSGSNNEHPLILSTYDQRWVVRYREQDYFSVDPLVRMGRSAFLPIEWDRVQKTTPALRRFFDESESYGVGTSGISLPLSGGGGERAMFTLTSHESGARWRDLRACCAADLLMVAHYLHDRAMDLAALRPQAPLRALSFRELECIRMAGRGRTPKGIAADLGISDTAVRLHLAAARSKLRCATLPQAVAVAVSLGLFTL